jgi:hypothetical protein
VCARSAAKRVVVSDQLRRHAGDRKQHDGHQAGPVAASDAVEEHTARPRLFDRIEHTLDPIREALHERAVVKRGRELRPVRPVDPEVRILVQPVQRDVDRLHASTVLDELVVVAQIDDRFHAVCAKRFPAGGAEAIDGLGAN